jgi:hypothetical protein
MQTNVNIFQNYFHFFLMYRVCQGPARSQAMVSNRNFFSFSLTLSEPLMLRIQQKFKAQALAGVRSHTHMLIR